MDETLEGKTLVVLKPDALYSEHIFDIIERFRQDGLKIDESYRYKAPKEFAEQHYADPLKRLPEDIGRTIVNYLSDGDSLAMMVSGRDAVDKARKISGRHFQPKDCEPGTIRRDFGSDNKEKAEAEGRAVYNLVHTSDSLESAEKEIQLWFNKNISESVYEFSDIKVRDFNNIDSLVTYLAKKGEGTGFRERTLDQLKNLNILQEGEEFEGYEDIQGWVRGGEESYVATGRLYLSNDEETSQREFVAKAILTIDPDTTIDKMMDRRELLKSQGIKTPTIYSVDEGCIYQQFIPKSVRESVEKIGSDEKLLDELVRIGAVLDQKGFKALSYIGDLRTDLQDLYYVDLGFDLGEPGNQATDNSYKSLMKFVESNNELLLPERDLSLEQKKEYVDQKYQSFRQ